MGPRLPRWDNVFDEDEHCSLLGAPGIATRTSSKNAPSSDALVPSSFLLLVRPVSPRL